MKIILLYCDKFPRLPLEYTVSVCKAQGFEVVILTDEKLGLGVEEIELLPGYKGWWNKLQLFKYPSLGQVLYLDLDCLVVGNLFKIESYAPTASWLAGANTSPSGFVPGFCAGLFRVDVSEHSWVWERYQENRAEIEKMAHDQAWLNSLSLGVSYWPTSWVCSYKWHKPSEENLLWHFHGVEKWWSYTARES